jgi:hypothetical protein
MDCSDPIKLLQTVPFEYNVDMAYINQDILNTPTARSINTGRLNLFIQNIEKGVADCVFITTFGIDGPAITSILKFDGYNVTYTVDTTRYDSNDSINVYYVNYMYTDTTSEENLISTNYHVVTTDNNYTIYRDNVFLNVIRVY